MIYDVKEDIDRIDEFKPLTEMGMFMKVQLDQSRTCIYWSDRIDIASDTIYEYGEKIEK